MRCPFCQQDNDRVIDSRPNRDNTAIRRRRMCNSCAKRFTTYEYIENVPLQIIKKDGRREDFKRDKILNGIILACRKRSIPLEQIERIVDEIYEFLQRSDSHEVGSQVIGEQVMEKLQGIDQVAYVRFASVYKDFKDIKEFKKTIDQLFSGPE